MYMRIYKYFIYVKDKWVILQFKIVHDLLCHPKYISKKLDINRLKDTTVSFNVNQAMDVALDRMSCLTNPGEDANQKWAYLRHVVYATTASILGYKKRKNQDCFYENDGAISCLLEQMRKAFVKTLEDQSSSIVQAHKNICRAVHTELKKKDNWWNNKADNFRTFPIDATAASTRSSKLCLAQAHRQHHHSGAKMHHSCRLYSAH